MNNVLRRVAVAALCVCLPLGASYSQNMYITPSVLYTDDDIGRLVDDEAGGGQIALGGFANDNWAIEGFLGSSSLSGVDDLRLTELGLNGRFVMGRDNIFSPYLLFGVSFLDIGSDLFEDETAVATSAGLGLDLNFGDSPWALRFEYRYRRSDERGSKLDDNLGSLGITYAFGGPPTPRPRPTPEPAPDPDSDGDGVPDSADRCPDTPAGYRIDSRGCPLDSDGDGVIDEMDECPNTVRGASVDEKGCELDDDGDGVVNRLDQCPNTAPGVRVDIRGCEITEVIELPGVNFETNSDRLVPGTEGVLSDAAATLRRYPELVVEVAGHTDSQGAAEYNQGLSERRALTVRDFLIRAGANASNLSARGYGEAEPAADNATAEGRARNRRVELRIIGE